MAQTQYVIHGVDDMGHALVAVLEEPSPLLRQAC